MIYVCYYNNKKMEGFNTFVNNTMNNSILLNGYTTFMMCNENNRKDIKQYRMHWFVENYNNYDNVNKIPYYDYYKNNITDNYSGVFNPPPCFYNQMMRDIDYEEKCKKQEEQDEYNDDIAMHYREVANRHLRKCNNQNTINDDNDSLLYEDEYEEYEDNITDDIYEENSYESDYIDTDAYNENYDMQSEYEEDDYDY